MNNVNGRHKHGGENDSGRQPAGQSASFSDVDKDFFPEHGPLADWRAASPGAPKARPLSFRSRFFRHGFAWLQDFGPKPGHGQHAAAERQQSVKPSILLQHRRQEEIETPALVDPMNQLHDHRHRVANASPGHDIFQLDGAGPFFGGWEICQVELWQQ